MRPRDEKGRFLSSDYPARRAGKSHLQRQQLASYLRTAPASAKVLVLSVGDSVVIEKNNLAIQTEKPVSNPHAPRLVTQVPGKLYGIDDPVPVGSGYVWFVVACFAVFVILLVWAFQ